MKTTSQLTLRFAGVLGHRAGHRLRCLDPGGIARELECAGLGPETAHNLAWGLGGSLTTAEIDAVSRHFGFHAPVVALLFHPASTEIVEETLGPVYHGLHPDSCDQCSELAETIECFFDDRDSIDLDELLLELAEHLVVRG